MLSRPIVVQTTNFNENSGGSIVLHYLVHSLRKLGVEAYVSPNLKEKSIFYPTLIKSIHDKIQYNNFKKKTPSFKTMDTPIAPKNIISESIIIYPEIVRGNPLQSNRVVRWLLNKPGFFNGVTYEHNPKEEVFFYQYAFIDGLREIPKDNLLQVRWLRDDIYKNRNTSNRAGSCRMIRKGRKLSGIKIPTKDNAIRLDGKSHIEIAEIFNKTEIFFCHDPYTMYCYYAARCGCVPVVVPQMGLSRKKWRDGFEIKNGVAYGEDEIDWAKATRSALMSDMKNAKLEETKQLKVFLSKIRCRFE